MSWFSKYKKGGAALFESGPVGSIHEKVAAAFAKNATSRGTRTWTQLVSERNSSNASQAERSQIAFFTALFSMLAKLAKAGGSVSKAELFAIESFMDRELKLSTPQKLLAIKIFRTAKTAAGTFEDFAKQYLELFRDEPAMLENLIDILFAVAIADGKAQTEKEILIERAANIFALPPEVFDRIRSRYAGALGNALKASGGTRKNGMGFKRATIRSATGKASFQIDDPYRVLGCSADDSLETIRKSYLRLVRKFHPDTVIGQGLPPEFQRFASKRFREIKLAFDRIIETRGSDREQ